MTGMSKMCSDADLQLREADERMLREVEEGEDRLKLSVEILRRTQKLSQIKDRERQKQLIRNKKRNIHKHKQRQIQVAKTAVQSEGLIAGNELVSLEQEVERLSQAEKMIKRQKEELEKERRDSEEARRELEEDKRDLYHDMQICDRLDELLTAEHNVIHQQPDLSGAEQIKELELLVRRLVAVKKIESQSPRSSTRRQFQQKMDPI